MNITTNNKHVPEFCYFVIKPGVPTPIVPRAYHEYELAEGQAAASGGVVTNDSWLRQKGFDPTKMIKRAREQYKRQIGVAA